MALRPWPAPLNHPPRSDDATRRRGAAPAALLRRTLPSGVDPRWRICLDRAGILCWTRATSRALLACAEEASRARNPRLRSEAHHKPRAGSPSRPGRLDEARDCARACPRHRACRRRELELAAELYINRLARPRSGPPSASNTPVAGARVAPGGDRLRGARLAPLEGQALWTWDAAGEALRPARRPAVKLDPYDALRPLRTGRRPVRAVPLRYRPRRLRGRPRPRGGPRARRSIIPGADAANERGARPIRFRPVPPGLRARPQVRSRRSPRCRGPTSTRA
jgi:hypothetical protein